MFVLLPALIQSKSWLPALKYLTLKYDDMDVPSNAWDALVSFINSRLPAKERDSDEEKYALDSFFPLAAG